MLARLADAEAMSLDDYRNDLTQRDKARALYAQLDCDACISLSAPAAAPLGLDSTGDPACTAHASLLGIPAISLPLLQDDGLPLGLQVTGFINGDAEAFGVATAVKGAVSQVSITDLSANTARCPSANSWSRRGDLGIAARE
jgi:Asp-tRNA(Asn)/Glu-tRNA(Gln) amidotransferase A subunit family amidase